MEAKEMKALRSIAAVLALLAISLIGCREGSSTSANSSVTGRSGSLARFAIVGRYLYTVDREMLRLFDLESGAAKFVAEIHVGFNIETIFGRKNTLFLGARNGVYIYDISKPDKPIHLSTYQHIASCDPVVADEYYAYSTLSSGRPNCWRGLNALDIIDVSDLYYPKQTATIIMDDPRGLGLTSANRLVVCDKGLKLIDITNRHSPLLLHYLTGERPSDIIPGENRFVAVMPDGISNYAVVNDSLQYIGTLSYK